METVLNIKTKWYDYLIFVVSGIGTLIGLAVLFASPVLKSILPLAIGSSFYANTCVAMGSFAFALVALLLAAYSAIRLKKDNFATAHVYAFIFFFILSMNLISPLIADDFGQTPLYGISFASIKDILNRLAYLYVSWTGRLPAHFLSYMNGMLGSVFFDIANTSVFCLYIFLVTSSFKNNKLRSILTFFIFAFIWLFQPVFGQDILWRAGSCNYLWTATIVLLFLKVALPARQITSKKTIKLLGIFIFGLIGGWCNENVAITVFILMIAEYIIQNKLEKKKLGIFNFFALAGWFCGMLVLICAPGNYIRMEVDSHYSGGTLLYTIGRLAIQIANLADRMIANFAPHIIMCIVLCAAYSVCVAKKNNSSALFARLATWIIGFGISLFSLAFALGSATRAFFFTATILYIIIAHTLGYITLLLSKKDQIVINWWYPVLILVMLISMTFEFAYSTQYFYRNEQRTASLLRQKAQGADPIYLNTVYASRKYMPSYELEDISDDPSHFINSGYSYYYAAGPVLRAK